MTRCMSLLSFASSHFVDALLLVLRAIYLERIIRVHGDVYHFVPLGDFFLYLCSSEVKQVFSYLNSNSYLTHFIV